MTGGSEGINTGDGGGATSVGNEKEKKEKKPRSFWKELPILILIALALALVIKSFFVQAFSIPSQSMQNTLQVGDRVLVDKLTPWFGAKPERGDVVVFHDPGHWLETPPQHESGVASGIQTVLSWIGLMPSADEQDLIKRVIAVGGDTISCPANGPVKVNGKALDEKSYIYPGATPCGDWQVNVERPKTITVPKGKLWVMGDHRNDSLDSRFHTAESTRGFVPESQVVGRAFAVAWPINRWSILHVPSTFDNIPQGKASAAAATGTATNAAPPVGAPGPALPAVVLAVGLLPLARRRLRSRRGAPEASGTVSGHGDTRIDDDRD